MVEIPFSSTCEHANIRANNDNSYMNCVDYAVQIKEIFCHPVIYKEPHNSTNVATITDFNAKKLEENPT